MSRQHRPFSIYFVSTNATGVKSSSAALNPVTLPLHKHGLVLIPFVRHTYEYVRPGEIGFPKMTIIPALFSMFVNSFAQQRTQYI